MIKTGGANKTMNNKTPFFTHFQCEQLEDRCVPATLVVTQLTDSTTAAIDNNDGELTLREAIQAVNNGALAGTDGADASLVTGIFGTNDTIIFEEGLDGTITLVDDMLAIAKSVEIDGSTTSGSIAVDGAANSYLPFAVNANDDDINVSFNALTIQNGQNDGSGGGLSIYNGDFNDTVTISNSTITGNIAGTDGGGVHSYGANLFLNNTTLSYNQATGDGGGVHVFFYDHTSGSYLSFIDSTFKENTAGGTGGGIDTQGFDGIIDNATITGNTGSAGGGMYFDGVYATGGDTLTLQNSTITYNTATAESGGGIYFDQAQTIEITNTVVSNNYVTSGFNNKYGGGILIFNADITIEGSSIVDNEVRGNGGGVAMVAKGNLTLIDSTVSGNSATKNAGGVHSYYTLTVVNSTIGDNTAGDNGGGVHIKGVGDTTITNSTISGNDADQGGGIYIDGTVNSFTLNNSIVGGNSATTAGTEVYIEGGLFADGSNNLFTNAGVVGNSNFANSVFVDDITDVINTTLADNGGPTQTFALLEDSEAINAGDNALALDENGDTLTADQRGFEPRINNSTVDIGAVEYGAAEPEPDPDPIPVIDSDVGASTFQAFTVTITGSDITLDDIDVVGGQARLLTDNGDGTFTVTIAPNQIGTVTVSAPDIDTGEISTVFDSLSFGSTDDDFIRNLYTVIYTRTPTDDEVEFWTQEMAEGATRKDVLAGFLASSEFRGAFADNAAVIDGIYQLLFDRDADTDFWSDLLDGGTSLDEVVLEILSSEEYYDRLVRETYNEFLLREIDDAGLAYWVDELLAGNINSNQLRTEIASSDEAQDLAT